MYSEEEVTLEVKKHSYVSPCFGCLSTNRKLLILGDDTPVFCKLFENEYLAKASAIMLCWECTAMLRKVKLFKEKVAHAQTLLNHKLASQINASPDGLSNLKLTAIELTHFDETLQDVKDVDIKDEKPDEVLDQNIEYEDLPDQCDGQNNDSEHQTKNFEGLYLKPQKNVINQDTTKSSQKKPRSTAKKRVLCGVDVKNTNETRSSKRIKKTNVALEVKVEFENKETKNKIEKLKEDVKLPSLGKFEELNTSPRTNKVAECFTDKSLALKLKKKIKEDPDTNRSNKRNKKYKNKTRSQSDNFKKDTTNNKKQKKGNRFRYRYIIHEKGFIRKHVPNHKTLLQCQDCMGLFQTKDEFDQHYCVCDHCGRRYETKDLLQQHIVTKHIRNTQLRGWLLEDSYCVTCNRQYTKRRSYDYHLKTHPSHAAERASTKVKIKKKYPCTACDKVLASNQSRRAHYSTVHLNLSVYRRVRPPVRSECQHCGKTFAYRDHMNRHIQVTHFGVKEHACDYCQRRFSTKPVLVNHIRTHTGERPFHCEYCDAKFAQRVAMKQHVKFIHLKARRETASSSYQSPSYK